MTDVVGVFDAPDPAKGLELVQINRVVQQEPWLPVVLLVTQFAYVYDHASQAVVFLSAGLERLLGEQPHAARFSLDWLRSRLHPDDAPVVAQAQAVVCRYLQERRHAPLPRFRSSLDYRLRHADGHYRRVLHQHLIMEREPGPGAVRRSLVLFTDLTHHKLTQEVRHHVNQPDFAAFAARLAPLPPPLTSREQQILALVLQGLTSRQIAYQLQLRESTVKTHRRNLLRKTGSGSFHALLGHLPPEPNDTP